MTQADFTVANQTFPNTRAEINTSLQALATNSAGNSEPATKFPSQWWFDSDDNKLYMRNKDNDAWVEILTIGATSDKVESIGSGGGLTITTADNTDTLTLTSTDVDANSGPNLRLYRNSSSPADSDVFGQIDFEGKNSAAEDFVATQIKVNTGDVTDGTEDAQIEFDVMTGGTLREYMRMAAGSNPAVIINQDSRDINFQVLSDGNDNMLFVNAGDDAVGIGTNVTNSRKLVIGTGGAKTATSTHYVMNIGQTTEASSHAGLGVYFVGGASAAARVWQFQPTENGVANDGVIEFCPNGGKVGIGTSSPAELFEIASGSDPAMRLNGGASGNPLIDFAQNGTQKAYIQYLDSGDLWTFQSDGSTRFLTGGSTERMRLDNTGIISSNAETAGDVSRGGLCLNQGTHDTNILTFKSDDINHGMTSNAETDTYAEFVKQNASIGGLAIHTYTEQKLCMDLQGHAGLAEESSPGTSSFAPVRVNVKLKSGTGGTALGNGAHLFCVSNDDSTKFMIDGDGTFHSDGSGATYDIYEDAQLVRAFDLSHGKGVIDSKFDKFISYNHEKLAELKLVGREKDGTPNYFINYPAFNRLHNGAIWQQYEKHQKLANAMYELAKAAVGEDKANEILEQNEIKLLN